MTIQIRTPEEPTEIDADAFPDGVRELQIRVTVDEDGNEHCLVYAGDLQSADAPLHQNPFRMPELVMHSVQ